MEVDGELMLSPSRLMLPAKRQRQREVLLQGPAGWQSVTTASAGWTRHSP